MKFLVCILSHLGLLDVEADLAAPAPLCVLGLRIVASRFFNGEPYVLQHVDARSAPTQTRFGKPSPL